MSGKTEIAIATPRADRIPGGQELVRNGSWWRPSATAAVQAQRFSAQAMPPDHGLVLLVSAVHLIDGQIHSVTLHPHPGWQERKPVRVLAEEFLRDFSEEREGEVLREREIDRAMGRTQSIVAAMSRVPPEDELLALSPPAEPSSASGPAPVRVPAVLVPGGDLRAAQERIGKVMAIANARQGWIEAQSRDMRAAMDVVVAYQSEKVEATTADMRDIAARATHMLRNVRSMDLWLGQGIDLHRISSGVGAPADAPLSLFQRMLYLDEELHVGMLLNGMLREDGFSWRDLGLLPEILAANPDILDRMMPAPRSAVIARIRRKDRPIASGLDMGSLFAEIESREADRRVFILIRDGQNVSMIRADPETSAATRLFPSRTEIDALFQAPAGYDWSKGRHLVREIRPEDLDYVEARQAHEDRALHYKRFLLILWGLHEREGVFGDFLPEGSNWLSETVHSSKFRFIHDDEGLLTDARPPLREWIREKNSWLRSGSTVLLETRQAIHSDSAPTIVEIRGDRESLKRIPTNEFVSVTPGLRGAQIVAGVETRKHFDDKDQMTPVILRHADGRTNDRGTLCLDRVSATELRGYIDDRRAREDYLDYLGLFVRALSVCEAREAIEAPLAETLLAQRPGREAEIRDVLIAQREISSGTLDPASIDEVALLAKVDLLHAARQQEIADGSRLILSRSGALRRQSPELSGIAARLRLPLLRTEECRFDRAGALKVRQSGLDPVLSSFRPGDILVSDRIGQTAVMARIGQTPKGLNAPSQQPDLLRAFAADPAREAAVRSILGLEAAWPDLLAMIEPLREWNWQNGDGMVCFPELMVCAGIAIVPDTRWITTQYRAESPEVCPGHYPHRAISISLAINPVAQAFKQGDSEVIEACSRFYRNPEFGLEDLRRCHGKVAPLRITARSIRDEEDVRAALRAEPWLGERHSVSLGSQDVFRIRETETDWEPPRSLQGAIARSALLRTSQMRGEVTAEMIADFDWFLPRVDLVASPEITDLLEDRLLGISHPGAATDPDRDAGQTLEN